MKTTENPYSILAAEQCGEVVPPGCNAVVTHWLATSDLASIARGLELLSLRDDLGNAAKSLLVAAANAISRQS